MTVTGEVSDEHDAIHKQLENVARQLDNTLTTKLKENVNFEVVPVDRSKETGRAVTLPATAEPLSRKDFANAGVGRDVQAVLVVNIAGYGKLKREWITFLLGTGVAEGLVQGVVAARVVSSPGVGIAVGLEEIGQEFLVWGGGSYLFDAYYSPVTLEARLISTADGRQIWDDTIFTSTDKKAIKALPEEEQNKREIHLILTAKKAINELVADLTKVAKRNSTPPGAGAKQGHTTKKPI